MSKVKQKVDVMYSVRITQELEDTIVKVAALEGRTKTNVIRHYLELGLKVGGKAQYLDTPAVQYIDGDDDDDDDEALQEILNPNF